MRSELFATVLGLAAATGCAIQMPGDDGGGGAVFKATGSTVSSVAFSGDSTGITLLGSIDFTGIEKTPTGYLAMAYASDVIASRDGGNTFTIEKNGSSFGIEHVYGYKVT